MKAPIQQVWQFIINPELIGNCVPGCEKIEAIDDRTYVATVKAGVGPIKVRFKVTTSLTQIDEPKHIHMEAKGADLGMAGNFTQGSDVYLREVSATETEVAYSSNVTVNGRIALIPPLVYQQKNNFLPKHFDLTKFVSAAIFCADESCQWEVCQENS